MDNFPLDVGLLPPDLAIRRQRRGFVNLTFAQAVEEIAQATGHNIRYVPISIEQHAAAVTEHGLPSEVIELLTYLFSKVLDGRNAHLADGVQRALGRGPRDFSDYGWPAYSLLFPPLL